HPLCQVLGKHAQPPADLQHHVAGPELGRPADHAEEVRVDQEVLAQLPVRADVEPAQAPEAGLGGQLGRAHHPSTSAALRSTTVSSSSYETPRYSATARAVCTTCAGSFSRPRIGWAAR